MSSDPAAADTFRAHYAYVWQKAQSGETWTEDRIGQVKEYLDHLLFSASDPAAYLDNFLESEQARRTLLVEGLRQGEERSIAKGEAAYVEAGLARDRCVDQALSEDERTQALGEAKTAEQKAENYAKGAALADRLATELTDLDKPLPAALLDYVPTKKGLERAKRAEELAAQREPLRKAAIAELIATAHPAMEGKTPVIAIETEPLKTLVADPEVKVLEFHEPGHSPLPITKGKIKEVLAATKNLPGVHFELNGPPADPRFMGRWERGPGRVGGLDLKPNADAGEVGAVVITLPESAERTEAQDAYRAKTAAETAKAKAEEEERRAKFQAEQAERAAKAAEEELARPKEYTRAQRVAATSSQSYGRTAAIIRAEHAEALAQVERRIQEAEEALAAAPVLAAEHKWMAARGNLDKALHLLPLAKERLEKAGLALPAAAELDQVAEVDAWNAASVEERRALRAEAGARQQARAAARHETETEIPKKLAARIDAVRLGAVRQIGELDVAEKTDPAAIAQKVAERAADEAHGAALLEDQDRDARKAEERVAQERAAAVRFEQEEYERRIRRRDEEEAERARAAEARQAEERLAAEREAELKAHNDRYAAENAAAHPPPGPAVRSPIVEEAVRELLAVDDDATLRRWLAGDENEDLVRQIGGMGAFDNGRTPAQRAKAAACRAVAIDALTRKILAVKGKGSRAEKARIRDLALSLFNPRDKAERYAEEALRNLSALRREKLAQAEQEADRATIARTQEPEPVRAPEPERLEPEAVEAVIAEAEELTRASRRSAPSRKGKRPTLSPEAERLIPILRDDAVRDDLLTKERAQLYLTDAERYAEMLHEIWEALAALPDTKNARELKRREDWFDRLEEVAQHMGLR